MNLDELKTAWKVYDRKLQSTKAINEKIIISMITERSGSRYAKVWRQYIIGIAWMLICLAFSILVIFTNPFDYRYNIQYIPMVIFAASMIVLLGGMFRSFMEMQRITITQHNVGDALKGIIAIYEKPKKFFHYIIMVFLFSQVVLLPLSFLPRNLDTMGLSTALAERLIPISIAALVLFLAYKLGAFKERQADKFREDLNELESLKAMSAELSEI